MTDGTAAGHDAQPEPQTVTTPLAHAAIFLVVCIEPGREAFDRAMGVVADIGDLVRAVGFRIIDRSLSCVVGLSSDTWDRLDAATRPRDLHPFIALHGDRHIAPATPGDLLFHIKAPRADLCFELERLLLDKLGDSVRIADETQGFRYFDSRDLLGFVDGTENPTGTALSHAVLIDDDPGFDGGSYVMVQKYTHDLDGWHALPVEEQERVIGRTKLDDVELDDTVQPSNSHVTLNSITDDDGNDLDVLRDNMPFGSPARGEFGTYYIAYAKDPAVPERMLRNMFLGDPPGNYDRILDFSTAMTGTQFFVPSLPLLESLPDLIGAGSASPDPADPPPPVHHGSLTIGSLKGEPR